MAKRTYTAAVQVNPHGRMLVPGEEFDADSNDPQIVQWLRDGCVSPAGDTGAAAKPPRRSKPKNYKRRDLQAEV